MKVAVLGGTGKTGRAVTTALARAGVHAHPLGRAALDDLPTSLTGSDAVYLIAPNLHPDEPGYVARVLAAMAIAGVRRLGYHSVASPYVPSMPHHLGKAVAEDAVRRSGTDWTILQPCAYVQNFVPALRDGDLVVPYAVDAPFGLVDLGDGRDARERDWLRAMFHYYDEHGLPTGAVPLAALLGQPQASVADVLARELTTEAGWQ